MIFIPMSGVLVPETVMAPGPPKAIGKGLLPNAFIAQAWTERYVAGRSLNSLMAGLARHGAEISAATVTGACAQAGTLLVPLEEAIPPGPGPRGTCTPTRHPGTCSARGRGTARPAGGCGCSSARSSSARPGGAST